MRGWRSRRASSDDVPTRVPATVCAGAIRTPGEADALPVTLSISYTGVAMHADDTQLGSWPPSGVEISRIDDRSFSFVAEGDRLVFEPDDPSAFAEASEVLTPPEERPRRTRAKRERTKERDREKRTRSTPTDRTTRRSRPARDADRPTASDSRPTPRPLTDLAATPPDRPGPWLRLIDLIRPYAIFSLDRVPVDTGLRGREHTHTWDHVAARPTGPSAHVCTVCGKVRLRTRRST